MSTKPKAPVGLDLVEDDFTEEEHQKMDARLLSMYNIHMLDNGECWSELLRSIADQLGDRANRAYLLLKDFETLIEKNQVLLDMLRQGVKEGFKSVRCLKILRSESVLHLSEDPVVEPPIETTGTAQRAWHSEYQGHYAEVLLKNINALPRSATHVNCIPIIQSSGYGKSRMVDELAKSVFTLPFNIRKPGEHQKEQAYPPSDDDIWEYLCGPTINTMNDAEELVAQFFSNLFLRIVTEIKHFPKEGREPQGPFAQRWREHLSGLSPSGTNRSQLYREVVHASRESVLDRKTLFERVWTSLGRLLRVLAEYCEYPNPDDVQIVLYFDEAHELDRGFGSGGAKKLYDAVLSTLAEFRQSHVFTIFLSTQSSMPLLAPSSKRARSARQQETEVLWGPITEAPFDCHPVFPIRAGQYKLEEVSRPEFMIRFGRPLFWTMFELEEEVDKLRLLKDMMKLARKKLLCVDHIASPASSYNSIARIAILDVLITVDYEPKRETARNFEMDLVANHMRTAFSIPVDRTYVHSGYSSEPFLAEAASRQMHHFMKASSSYRAVDDLKSKLSGGLIDLCQKGEVVMRLLLRKAYMDAIVEEQGAEDPNFSYGCRFVAFLGALLTRPYDTDVLRLEPNNIAENKSGPGQSLAAIFGHAIVRFTHFIKAADMAAMTTTGMAMGFLRGAAIIGRNSQKKVDIAIPILMNKQDKLEEASMSALLIQVKRRHQRGTVNTYIIDTAKLDFFTQGVTKDSTPYVTLITELGTSSPEGNVKLDQPLQWSSPCTQTPRPRYSIWAYGCTHNTWKVIQKPENDAYREILAFDDLLGDHPRQDEASLDIAYRMLPSWYAEPAWFSSEGLDSPMVPVGEVAVGVSLRSGRPRKRKR